MRFHLIITKGGAPLTNEAGTVLLFRTEQQARKWAMAGESVRVADAELVGDPAFDDDDLRADWPK
jgi:hypothetical protein